MATSIPTHALLENERPFLVREPPELAGTRVRRIEDLYLEAGRLRGRRITHVDDHPAEHKLCKKYGSADPISEPITNIYLTAQEHAALAALPRRPLSKRRHTVDHDDGRAFGVDVFEGALSGLVMCEAEAPTAEAIRKLTFPPWVGREVTTDLFFTGGNLSTISAGMLAARLATEIAAS